MPTPAPRWCSASGAEIGVVAERDGDVQPRAARTMPPNDTSCQSRLGASRTSPSLRRTRPGTLIPMPTRRCRRRRVRDDLADQARRPSEPTCHASASPAMTVAATLLHLPTEADPGHHHAVDAQVDRDRRTGRPAASRTPAEGRPAPCAVPTAGDVARRRRATRARRPGRRWCSGSAPSRWSARRARLCRRWCTWRSRVPRLWRRTASWLVPVPARRSGAHRAPSPPRRRLRSDGDARSRRRSRRGAGRHR